MLAYVFWHQPASTTAQEYEKRLARFHENLREHPPEGFLGSAAYAIAHADWIPSKVGYEDWYYVEDFAALGALNDAAVTGPRKPSHDAAAEFASWGTAGVYKLLSSPPDSVRWAAWLRKAPGQSYDAFFKAVASVTASPNVSLWQRQMTLGPASEFCVQARDPQDLPRELVVGIVDVRRVV